VLLGVVGTTVLGIVFTVKSGDVRWLFLSLPVTLVLFVIGRYAPVAYRLAGDGVHVERRAGPKVVPYRRVRSVDREPRAVGWLSVFASKGVFGRFGWFWSPTLRFHRAYLTNQDNVVWLDTDDGWIALSPDRPDDFVDRLRGRVRLVR
jgi:hypothetical protein